MSKPCQTVQPEVRKDRRPASPPGARLVLARILAQIDWYRDAPLSFEIDTAGIAMQAWNSFAAEWVIARRDPVPAWSALLPALDELVSLLLDEHGFAPPGCATGFQTRPIVEQSPENWVARLQLAARSADSQGPKILQLLAEGFPVRDAARKLAIGLQLTKRILRDMQDNWLNAETPAQAPC